jgi:hypothetical protein
MAAGQGGQVPVIDPQVVPEGAIFNIADMLYLDVPSEYATIQEAIDAAPGSNVVIRIAEGLYYGNYTVLGKSVHIQGDGDVQLEPDDDAPVFTIELTPEDGLVHLEGLQIQTSDPRGVFANLQDGHAVKASGARLQLTECAFEYCRVGMGDGQESRDGGAVRALDSDVWIDRTGFFACQASGRGGAVYGVYSTIEMRESSVVSCSAGDTGGGVSVWKSDLALEQCSFDGNTSETDGGHVRLSGGELVVTRCLFEDGEAADGGALFLESAPGPVYPEATFEHSRFAANYSSEPTIGADVIKQKDGSPTLTHDVWFCESSECDGVSEPRFGFKYDDNCGECWADTNFDGTTDVQDLLEVLMYWGTRDPFVKMPFGDGGPEVDAYDLIEVLDAFGTCDSYGGGSLIIL